MYTDMNLKLLNKTAWYMLCIYFQGFETVPSQRDLVKWRMRAIIDQPDMYTHVFSVFEEQKDIESKFMIAVLVEYIRSLNQYQIPVQVGQTWMEWAFDSHMMD